MVKRLCQARHDKHHNEAPQGARRSPSHSLGQRKKPRDKITPYHLKEEEDYA